MASSNRGKSFLKEFKSFITFLKNLWGLLAGISVLFPLSNILIALIPLATFDEGGVLVWFSPALITTLTTLTILFLILGMFGRRDKFLGQRGNVRLNRQALLSFVAGVASVLVYLIVYFFLSSSAYDVLGWESMDIRRLMGEVPLMILYASFFAFTTRAFVLLGMIEYFRREE